MKVAWRRLRRPLLKAWLYLCAQFPLPVLHAVGWGLGWGLGWLPNPLGQVAATNLALCFPHLPAPERRALLRRHLQQLAMATLELGPLWLWPGPRVLAHIRAITGEAPLGKAMARGGAMVLTPHWGAWEVAGLYLSSRYPMTFLYRPSRLGLDDLVHPARQRLGGRAVAVAGPGLRVLCRDQDSGRLIGVLPDQEPAPTAGVFAPWFGQPALTATLVGRLVARRPGPVFIVGARRLPRGRGYDLECWQVTAPATPDDVSWAAAVNAAVERVIRRAPEQYLWCYRRFKHRPAGAAPVYLPRRRGSRWLRGPRRGV